MGTFARLEDGTVVEVVEFDGGIEGRYHPSLVWIPCPPSTEEGWRHDTTGDEFVPRAPARAELDATRAAALIEIDTQAGQARAAFAAPGAFQAEEYQRAAAQAVACLTGAPGPFAALEADLTAGTVDPRLGRPVATLEEAADLIMATQQRWYAALDAVRAVRLSAKAAVLAADTPDAIAAVLAALAWPRPDTVIPAPAAPAEP